MTVVAMVAPPRCLLPSVVPLNRLPRFSGGLFPRILFCLSSFGNLFIRDLSGMSLPQPSDEPWPSRFLLRGGPALRESQTRNQFLIDIFRWKEFAGLWVLVSIKNQAWIQVDASWYFLAVRGI